MLIEEVLLSFIEKVKKDKIWSALPSQEKERLAEITRFISGEYEESERKEIPAAIYQFKITLKGIRPPIWRRFLISNEITFDELHDIIQVVMGWENYHLYGFSIDGIQVSIPDDLFFDFGETYDAEEIAVGELITEENQKCLYTYDFGDDWEHELVLEKILPVDEKITVPICQKGKRACHPEDCGGVYIYKEMLQALKGEGKLDEHIMDWLGDFDAEKFDLEAINEELSKFTEEGA